jgi:hypothetical protein
MWSCGCGAVDSCGACRVPRIPVVIFDGSSLTTCCNPTLGTRRIPSGSERLDSPGVSWPYLHSVGEHDNGAGYH